MSKMYEYVIHVVYEDGGEESLLVQWPGKNKAHVAECVAGGIEMGNAIRIDNTVIRTRGLRFATVHTRAEYEALVEKPDEVQP